MKDFSLFDIADFVMDEDFIRWVNGRSSTDDNYWENWLKRNPHKHLIVAEARRILEAIGTEQHVVPPAVINLEIEKLLQAINHPSEPPVEQIPVFKLSTRWRSSGWKYAAAAILIIGLGVSTWIFTRDKKLPEKFAYATITSSRQLI